MCRKNANRRTRGRPKGSFGDGTLLARKLAKFAFAAFSGRPKVPKAYRAIVNMAQKPPETLAGKLRAVSAALLGECLSEVLSHAHKRDYFYRSFCSEYQRLTLSNDEKEWRDISVAIAVKHRLVTVFGARTIEDAISIARRSILSLDRRNIDQADRLAYVKKSANYGDYQMVMDALKSGKHNNIALDLPEGWTRAMRLVWASEV